MLAFSASQMGVSTPKGFQLPKNSIVNRKLIRIMWEYSAKKNKANCIEEYSTLYPDTSSDSPSVKSKGALLVSANADIRNIAAAGSKGIIKGKLVCWALVISKRLSEPAHRITVRIIRPMETS